MNDQQTTGVELAGAEFVSAEFASEGEPETAQSARNAKDADRLGERGQATAEYALVIVAAAAIALALIVWASSSGALSSLFDTVMARVSSHV